MICIAVEKLWTEGPRGSAPLWSVTPTLGFAGKVY